MKQIIFLSIFTFISFVSFAQIDYSDCAKVVNAKENTSGTKSSGCNIEHNTYATQPYVIQIAYYGRELNSGVEIVRWKYGEDFVFIFHTIFNSYQEAKKTLPYVQNKYCEDAFVTPLFVKNVVTFDQ